MLHKTSNISYILLKTITAALFLISGTYIIYSIRAGTAQALFHNKPKTSSTALSSKGITGTPKHFINNDILVKCKKAERLYPYNYRLMAWGAEEAFERSETAVGRERDKYISLAESLCDKGLSLNRYMMPLPYIKMQLLCLRSPKEGISYWEKHVEWDYWNSYNHAVLASLYAADGKFGKAMQSLQFIKGTEDFAEANKIVQDYWDADSAMPPSLR